MGEIYTGPKFETVFQSNQAPEHTDIEYLKNWCSTFHAQGLTPSHESGTAGNLSFRIFSGCNEFIITGAGLHAKCRLNESDFVHIVSCNISQRKVWVKGTRLPSSESMMHYAIYNTLPEVNAVFHGHHQGLIKYAKALDLPVTETVCEYGSPELIESILPMLQKNKLFIIRDHGFISCGNTMNVAGELAVSACNQTNSLNL